MKTEVLEIIRDTRAYLLLLKETGVEEMPASNKIEVKKSNGNPPPLNPLPRGEGRYEKVPIISTSLEEGEHQGMPIISASLEEGERQEVPIIPPPLTGGGEGEGGTAEGEKKIQLDALLAKIGDCKRCKLWEGRTNIVFGTGNPDTKLLFIGEGPGQEEDRQGLPFVGRAGELLTNMIVAMGLTRDDVYIANVVKCRPPGNRNPEPDEISACSPFLKEQINIIKPEIICALGTFASHTLLETKIKISEIRGKVHEKDGYRIIPTFHPAYLLRNPQEKRLSWEDLQIIMKELGIESEVRSKK